MMFIKVGSLSLVRILSVETPNKMTPLQKEIQEIQKCLSSSLQAVSDAFAFAVACSPHPTQKTVISTEATDGLIVRCAVERPPHFVFALAVACSPNPPKPIISTE